ncbi:hypothetical protein LO772_19865 [Yinghuangia sp. ASG 101]|uniref:BACON domain-containing protein n=1 Tax=Yinghuangia sp. ASG 101 TaxID=2896848 RepID=UPI001E30574F|nr:hypothetical protein [Yinghuangia sp. ASG 101]UGQ09208.1 hypothetical protein LO772_19865 [Yinghuangia sp. ASG 101]
MTEPVTPHAAQSWGRAAYDAYAEGLYTYCLSVLRDHAAAGSSLRSTFVLADRHIGRLPDLGLLKPWLYALARYECLVRLDAGGPAASDVPDPDPGTPARPDPADAGPPPEPPDPDEPGPGDPARTRDELALLAWPESVGLPPGQREALDLAVRHGLDARGLAAVLGWEESHARGVVVAAGREVDRTRAALDGARAAPRCPEGSGLAAEVAAPGIRDRLVAHVDTCARCRPYTRLAAARLAPTTGPAASPRALPTVTPPAGLRAAVLGDVGRGRPAHRPAELSGRAARFDHTGFPVSPPGTGRRQRDRSRMTLVAVVVATVATVPALVLWQAATQGDRHAGRDTSISAARVTSAPPPNPGDVLDSGARPEPTAPAPDTGPARHSAASAEPSPAAPHGEPRAEPRSTAPTPSRTAAPAAPSPAAASADAPASGPIASDAATPDGPPLRPFAAPDPAADRRASPLAVDAAHDSDRTVITLRNTGAEPVDWTAEPSAAWLRVSRRAGTLAPGATETVTVRVDSAAAPSGTWSANVLIEPGGSRVWIDGSTDDDSPGPTRSTATVRPRTSRPPPDPGAGG